MKWIWWICWIFHSKREEQRDVFIPPDRKVRQFRLICKKDGHVTEWCCTGVECRGGRHYEQVGPPSFTSVPMIWPCPARNYVE